MSNLNVIRAWKDEEYRLSLSDAERAGLPDNPAGIVEIPDEDLEGVVGAESEHIMSLGCCPGLTRAPGYCSLACDTGDSTCSRNMTCPKVIDEPLMY